jgi:hypothetical protein
LSWSLRRRKKIQEENASFYRNRKLLMDLLKDEPCMDCGKKFPPSAWIGIMFEGGRKDPQAE